VIDTHAASPALRRLVIEMFDLVRIGESDGRELYRPRHGFSVLGA
jgi:hypothetical protein